MPQEEDYFFKELRQRLSYLQQQPELHRRQAKLYQILKEYLEPLGHWKVKPRGKPFREGADERRVSPYKKDQDNENPAQE